MRLVELLLIALFVAFETAEHSLFRVRGTRARRVLCICVAVAFNIIGLGIWLTVIKTARLGQALPLLAASNITIALSGHLLFGERVGARRWLGIALITLGVVCVSSDLS